MEYDSNNDDLGNTVDTSILDTFASMDNITTKLTTQELQDCANKVLSGIVEDTTSQAKWMQDTEDALRLSRLEKVAKNTPLPQSANIKYPLITTACYQFAARTYPELIQDGRIVKTEVIGRTNPMLDLIAEGVSTHMSYQLLGCDSEWEAGTDKLLIVLPNIGFVCRKTYWDPIEKKNCSEVCFYKDLILRNDPSIMCLEDLRRITHVLHCHPNDLVSGCRKGIYDEDAVNEIMDFYAQNELNPVCDLYEQHRFLDLDGDGYEEPYIVTVHKSKQKVLRIVARYTKEDIERNKEGLVVSIEPIQYFTDYHFLPAPDGSFMSVGFGSLMLHLNETVNTILNQLIDAGTLANLQTGFIDAKLKIMGGQMMVNPGEWTKVKGVIGQQLKDGIFPINYKEPSSTLYSLLGMLIQSAKDLTSSTDALQGVQNATNVPATSMLAMIEQGLKLHSAIQRRLYRALKDEFQKIFRLNGLYADQKDVSEVLGPDFDSLPNIYKTGTVKVIPVADPNLSSDAQRLSQAQVVMQVAMQPGSLINQYEAQKRMLVAAKVANIDAILPPAAANQPKAPDPKMLDMQAKNTNKQAEVKIKADAQALKEKEFAAKLSKMEAEIQNLQSGAVLNVSKADATKKNADVNDFNSKVQAVKTKLDATHTAHDQLTDAQTTAAKMDLEKQKLQIQDKATDNQHAQAVMGLQQNQDAMDNQQAQSDLSTPPTPPSDDSGA